MEEFRCSGEVTRRPKTDPSVRELKTTSTSEDNVAGVHREWWFHRACEKWFLAERDTRTNQVMKIEVPSLMRLAAQPQERIDRSRAGDLHLRRPDGRGVRGRHDRLRALRRGAADLFTELQVPSPARAPVLHRPLRQLPDDAWTACPNVRVCTLPAALWAVVKAQNVLGSLDRDWMAVTDKLGARSHRRASTTRRSSAPAILAALREVPAECRRPRLVDPKAERGMTFRRRASPRRRARHRRRAGGARSGHRRRQDEASRVALVDEGPEAGGDLLCGP